MFPLIAKDRVLYEVNLRQYSAAGGFRELISHLPRLRKMGADLLWLMPIHPIGEQHRKGTLGSYYSVRDYFSIDPAYGTLQEFKDLVRLAHEQGMMIILDWVANHTSWDNPLTQYHPEFYIKNEQQGFMPPFPEWEDVIKLNYDNYDVWRYMTQALHYWVEETGIDGFRCDMANLVPTAFWKEAITSLRRVKPVFMLAEAEDKSLLEAGFDVIYNWSIFHVFNKFIHQDNNALHLDQLLSEYIVNFPTEYNQMFFTSNHDENSWNGSAIERLGSALDVCTVLTFTLPGIPLIYSGQEAGNTKRLKFFDKDLIDWKSDRMEDFYERLCQLRKSQPALWSNPYGGKFRRISNSKDQQVFSFVREKNGNSVLVLVNLSWESTFVTLTGYLAEGEYFDYMTDQKIFLGPGAAWVLPSWGYLILIK